MINALGPQEWTAIWLSLRVALVATVAALPVAIWVAYVLARKSFPGRQLLNGVVHLPLVLPPVVTGYLLLVVFGQEGPGLSDQIRPHLDQCRSIPQFGSTRSINAGVAAGIAMHAWIRTHAV